MLGKEREDGLTLESYREQINMWYSANNVIREKAELYYDFISSLITLIDKTYLGSDVISTQEDMTNHFMWCFNKILSDFEHERIKFTSVSTTAYDYLWYFLYKGYYSSNAENKLEVLLEYFNYLFDLNIVKTPPELETFMDFYKIFDQNLKKIN
jgi:hypothetical protein